MGKKYYSLSRSLVFFLKRTNHYNLPPPVRLRTEPLIIENTEGKEGYCMVERTNFFFESFNHNLIATHRAAYASNESPFF